MSSRPAFLFYKYTDLLLSGILSAIFFQKNLFKSILFSFVYLGSGWSILPAGSKHFSDQAAMYIEGRFKNVLFYKEDVMKHVEQSYHPGE